MASLIQDLDLVETALGDVAAFAAGLPITGSKDGYNFSVQVLPNGPTGQFTAISGGILAIIGTVLADAAAFSQGAPVSLAVKENKTWYGVSLSKPVAA